MEFDCEHVRSIVGFTSVNVLYSIEQWKSIGGYDTNIDFYEDGEYNARLFAKYCGKRFPKPLVNYRQHDLQRVVKYNDKSHEYAEKILSRIRRLDMACPGCGKRRIAGAQTQNVGANRMMASTPAPTANVAVGSGQIDLPLELDGKILVRYFGGKGMAKHTKRGPFTNKPYSVRYGDFLYVLPADAVDVLSPGHPFQKVVRPSSAPVELPKTAEPILPPDPEPIESRVPKTNVIRTPVAQAEDLPDLMNTPLKQLKNMDLTPEQVVRLLAMEKTGKGRVPVVNWLKRRIKNDA
jgi:hypothetical protein